MYFDDTERQVQLTITVNFRNKLRQVVIDQLIPREGTYDVTPNIFVIPLLTQRRFLSRSKY